MRLMRILLVSMLVWLGGCASAAASKQAGALELAQREFASAMRWGHLDDAFGHLDPDWQAKHPLTAIERERYAQVQVTGYRPLNSEAPGEGLALRLIEIGVVNRHTMAERTVRYQERWRYDAASKAWVVTSGLPDLWAGR